MSEVITEHRSLWINGKSAPGWYMAKAVWSRAYAQDMRALGYEVECRRLKEGGGYREFEVCAE